MSDKCFELNNQIDFQERTKAILYQGLGDLEKQRATLLDNCNRYDALERQLLIDVKTAKKSVSELKKKNMELSNQLEITVQTDSVIRDKLSIRDRVSKLKSDNLRMLSSAKMQVVEKNLTKRYNVDTFTS